MSKFKEEYENEGLEVKSIKPIKRLSKGGHSVSKTIGMLNDNYGAERDVDKYLGGYIQVIESL